jgi:hypothetical protein
VVQNSSSAPVYIRFQGPVTRDFMLQVGKNVVQMPAGRYAYQYTACGIQFSDHINLPSGKVFRILPCKTTKIIIKNYTLTEAPGTGLTLRLSGPVNYYFTITKPLEKFTVQQGAYEFTLRGCGKLIQSGSIKFDTAQYRWTLHCSP